MREDMDPNRGQLAGYSASPPADRSAGTDDGCGVPPGLDDALETGAFPRDASATGRLVTDGGTPPRSDCSKGCDYVMPPETGPLDGPTADEWTSAYIGFERGWLTYLVDEDHNRIPDYSWAGYRCSQEPIPDVETVKTIDPVEGDNTDHIETAIQAVRSVIREEDREHAALELAPGEYRIEGPLSIRGSGVVVRGAGDGTNPAENTVVIAYGRQDPEAGPGWTLPFAVQVGSPSPYENGPPSAGPAIEITTALVRVGERTFEVADGEAFQGGDSVAIHHPCTRDWLEAVNWGDTADEADWAVGSRDIYYTRHIESIDGNEVTIDAPVYNHLDRDRSQSVLYRIDRSSLAREMGVEDLRLEIQATGDRQRDNDHRFQGIRFHGLQDAWARGCTVANVTRGGFSTAATDRVTIRDCRAVAPFSEITGGYRYLFDANSHAQLILFERCYAHRGRHSFVGSGTSTAAGLVFKDVIADQPVSSCEAGHHRWTQGVLFDRYESTGEIPAGYSHRLHIGNRGSYGSGHGWSAVHSLAWNSTVHDASRGILVERPPTAQNYSIGSRGPVLHPGPFDHPQGHVEGHDEAGVWPDSLFVAQLRARHARAGLGAIPHDVCTAENPTIRRREIDPNFFAVDPKLSVTHPDAENGELMISATMENGHDRAYDAVALRLVVDGQNRRFLEWGPACHTFERLAPGDTVRARWTPTVHGPVGETSLDVTVQATTVIDGSHQRSWDRACVQIGNETDTVDGPDR